MISTSEVRSEGSSEESDFLSKPPFNSFVIPGRTRYPSTQTPTHLEQLDLDVSRALLEQQRASEHDDYSKWRQNRSCKEKETQADSEEFQGGKDVSTLCGIFDGPFDTQPTSGNTSGQSASSFSGKSQFQALPASQQSAFGNASYFVATYNQLARRHGLRDMQTSSTSTADDTKQQISTRPTKHGSKNWFLTKLTRNASSKDLRRSNSHLRRKNSLSSLLGQRPKISLKTQSLEDIYRLGGVSVFDLPQKYKAFRLEMPTCLAATANYLILYGRDTPGIFRIPGQTTVTSALYDHYMFRILNADTLGSVEATVCSLSLPQGLSPSVHDVASAFKKFLWDLPGGILGSDTVFETLKDICTLPKMEYVHTLPESCPIRSDGIAKQDRAKLIALAIVSLNSNRRMVLICAVFGLLAFLKRDKDGMPGHSPSRYVGPESMSSEALGVVFAPILLGSLADDVESALHMHISTDDSELLTPKRSFLGNRRTQKHSHVARQSHEIAAGFGRAKACASVAEVLIRSWEDIVVEISQFIRSVSKSRQSSKHSEAKAYDFQSPGNKMQCLEYERQSLGRIQESNLTPTSTWETRGLSSLPYPPTPTLHFDPSIHRSASVSVMPITHGSGLRGQLQNPKNEKKLKRSNTALKLSDPLSDSAIQLSADRNVKAAPDMKSSAWWEAKTLAHPGEPQTRAQILAPRVPKTAVIDRNCSSASARQLSPMTDGAVNYSSRRSSCQDLPDQGERDALDDEPLVSHHESATKIGQLEQQTLQRTASSCNSSTTKLASRSHNQEIIQASQSPNALESEGWHIMNPKRDARPMRGVFKHSPSMIPRPVNEFTRSRGVASLRPTMSREHKGSATPTSAPLTMAGAQLADAQSLPRRYLRKSSGGTELQRPGVPYLPSRFSKSADRAFDPSRGSTANLRKPVPHMHEPSVARRINFRQSTEEDIRRTPSSSTMSHHESMRYNNQRPNVGTLYAEIRRLHNQLGAKTDEIAQLKHDIDALKRFRDSGGLNEKLPQAERDMRMWRCRAQWAETELFGRTEDGVVAGSVWRSMDQGADGKNQGEQGEMTG